MSEAKRSPKKAVHRRPKRDWHKRIVALLALLMAVLMVLPMVTIVFQSAGAATQEELQAQIDAGKSQVADLNEQIDALGEQLASIQNDKEQALAQKSILEQQVNALNESISSVTATIDQYDLLIADSAWDSPAVRRLLEVLASPEFKSRLTTLGGYILDKPGKLRRRF